VPVEPAPWLWLCAFPESPSAPETQGLRTGALDSIPDSIPDADQFWLGESVTAKDMPPMSAADRVATFLSQQRGISPEHTLPVLTHDMIARIFSAYAPAGTVDFPCFPPDDLYRFLSAREGEFVFVRVGPGSTTTTNPPDAEMDRLMRQHAASVNRTATAHVTRVTVRRRDDDEPDDGREDDEPDDGEDGGVREPRRPQPNPPPVSVAVDPDKEQP
jgi:hypothetical protein